MMASIDTMIERAREVMAYAYAPYSKFQVAACILGDNGQFYTGVNVENASYGLTLCAEAVAQVNMVADGCHKINSIVVMCNTNELCSPCGACRQRLHEFSSEKTMVHLCSQQALIKSITLDELLPLAFKFKP